MTRQLIEGLCSPICEGRAPGTAGSRIARAMIVESLRASGLDPVEQAVPGCNGANVIATIRGDVDRYVLVGAHYDHLGRVEGRGLRGGEGEGVGRAKSGGRDGSIDDLFFPGADDNAAAVGVLAEVARLLAGDHRGRGVIIAAFDAEEPPYFATGGMGSQEFVRANRLPIDFMVCMDLVGHRFGPPAVDDEVGHSLFALGAERSIGTYDLLAAMKRAEPGVILRPADAEIIPPLSDYEPFWQRRIPFLFLSAGRSRVYHTPEDTPDLLDYGKIAATARWLARFVTASRHRDRIEFVDGALDRVTLDEISEITRALGADQASGHIASLRRACDRDGRLPAARRADLSALIGMLESHLA